MRQIKGSLELSATDLVGYLNCDHLSMLDRMVAEGSLPAPRIWDPFLQILSERGLVHEREYVEHLKKAGLNIVEIKGVDVTDSAVLETRAAMERGAQIIVQGALSHEGWSGRIDVLRRVDTPSAYGDWSYEPVETKLTRGTKAGTILQLCLYCDLLTAAQGQVPEHMYVVTPWSGFEALPYRFADYAAFFRKVKSSLRSTMTNSTTGDTYPDPKMHCDICRWRKVCDRRRRDDDHPCLVAGISKLQINELQRQEITTVTELACMPVPLDWRPDRGSADAYCRVREQARIQVEARQTGKRKFEFLPVESGFGLASLPEPSEGDVFLDLEGDPFVGEHGLEYLFGYLATSENGRPAYHSEWALSRAEEKRAFENFVDFVMAHWEKHPDLHIYHYAPYEPTALKRLMGRYATREEEVDQMLRAGLFIDLYHVVRRGIRASVESYSIKRLEPFYEFEREISLEAADIELASLRASLELEGVNSILDKTKSAIVAYNKDDCRSATHLRDWLEQLRTQLVTDGRELLRPVPGDGAPGKNISDWQAKINELIERLSSDISPDPVDRNTEQHARWILANVLDWHRREEKAVWWEYFRLADLTGEDLLDERSALSNLSYLANVGGTARAPIHRYEFPPQETELRGDEDLRMLGGTKLGKLHAISLEGRTVDIKKRMDSVDVHPEAFFRT